MKEFLEGLSAGVFGEEIFFFKLFARSNLAKPTAALLIICVIVFGLAKFLGVF